MRKMLLALSLVLLFSFVLAAQDKSKSVLVVQDYPRIEVFGGYSFLHSGNHDSRLNAQNLPPSFVGTSIYLASDGTANLNGWEGSITLNLNKWVGITSDFSGHYGSMKFDEFQQVIVVPAPPPVFARTENPGFSSHSFLFGPRFTYRNTERVIPFAHVLFGVNREAADTSEIVPAPGIYDDVKETSFAFAAGGGLDFKISKRIAVRAPQIDYLLNYRNDDRHNNIRISAGLVFRLGGK
jgi:opacity protein-like surface antigen